MYLCVETLQYFGDYIHSSLTISIILTCDFYIMVHIKIFIVYIYYNFMLYHSCIAFFSFLSAILLYILDVFYVLT